ncbi:hypothetical protein EXIGLDRAFT_330124 [Exidia glandulosa HHB12029]|uniref:F-box domain-containing protein n=1 Tax=Exidia glandulosa HHB12029 TaxID=1314781 RepID=A0A165CSA6_EXIGL|nr:hypothetical protein EXIGLDRAFT_330124 [Exidia glandulosa HHB12029]
MPDAPPIDTTNTGDPGEASRDILASLDDLLANGGHSPAELAPQLAALAKRARAGGLAEIALHLDLSSLRMQLNVLKNDLGTVLERQERKRRGTPCTYRDVPADVWGLIFLEWLALEKRWDSEDTRCAWKWDEMRVPFVAASMCRLWRVAALGTQRLWTMVVHDFALMGDQESWLEYQNAHLERTGPYLPFTVYLICNVSEVTFGDPVWTQFRNTFLQRASNLLIIIESREYNSQILNTVTLPRLEELKIWGRGGTRIFDADALVLNGDLPRLRTINFTDVGVYGGPAAGPQRRFEAVTRLSVAVEHDTVEEFAARHEQFPNLDRLELTAQHFTGELTVPYVWAGLKTLELQARQIEDTVALALRFPDLENLIVDPTGPGPSWELFHLFVVTACPGVKQFSMQYGTNFDKFFPIMGTLDQIETLTFLRHCLRPTVPLGLMRPTAEGLWPFRGLKKLEFADETHCDADLDSTVLRELLHARRQAYVEKLVHGRLEISAELQSPRRVLFGTVDTDEKERRTAEVMAQIAEWNTVVE